MKRITLTQGQWAIVDDEDYKWLSKFTWHFSKGHAVRKGPRENGRQKNIYMHREINNTPAGLSTNHINGNSLDNRRSNLRSCTPAENNRTYPVRKDNSTGYKGVRVDGGKWRAQIWKDGKGHYSQSFLNVEDAVNAYNILAKKLHGEYARLNVL